MGEVLFYKSLNQQFRSDANDGKPILSALFDVLKGVVISRAKLLQSFGRTTSVYVDNTILDLTLRTRDVHINIWMHSWRVQTCAFSQLNLHSPIISRRVEPSKWHKKLLVRCTWNPLASINKDTYYDSQEGIKIDTFYSFCEQSGSSSSCKWVMKLISSPTSQEDFLTACESFWEHRKSSQWRWSDIKSPVVFID